MAPIKCMLHHMKNTANKRKAMYYFGANKVEELCLQDLMSSFESELADFKFINEDWRFFEVLFRPEGADTTYTFELKQQLYSDE